MRQPENLDDFLTPLPRLNGRAPDFKANTTHGPRQLSDYQGVG